MMFFRNKGGLNMKKITLLSVLVLASLSLVACSSNKQDKDKKVESKTSQTSSETKQDTSSEASTGDSLTTQSTSVEEQSNSESVKSETSTQMASEPEQSETTMPSNQNSTTTNVQDLDTSAILNGDFSTLSGTWKNADGDVAEITNDGVLSQTIKGNNYKYKILQLKNAPAMPTLNIQPLQEDGSLGKAGGAMIVMYKAGISNPYGDQSDTSQPRLILGQNTGNFPNELYFYRQ